MTGIPVQYDYINSEVSGCSPNTLHAQNTGLSRFFTRYLLQKAMSVFEWKMPKDWAKNYFLSNLYCNGFISIIETNKFGVIPQACGLQGYDVMYQPTHAIITNPLLTGILNPRIDKQCVLIRLQSDYGGLMDMVGYYADMMAIGAETAGINLFNSKLSYVFSSGTKAGAESMKKMFDEVSSGNPATFIDKDLLKENGDTSWQPFQQNVGQNYIAGKVLEDMRKWEIMFMSQIGIPNANTDKKERMVTDEVNANNVETKSLSGMWLEELQIGCKKAEGMFGIELSVDWREKEVTENESTSISPRNV